MIEYLRKINGADLNFICILCGFQFLSTLYANPSASICYRALGVIVSLACLISNFKNTIPKVNKCMGLFLIIMTLFTSVAIYQLFIGEYSCVNYKGKIFAYAFIFGVVWLPIIAYLVSRKKIDMKLCMEIIFVIMLFSVGRGLLSIHSQELQMGGIGRFSMNASQGTLAFGDNGMLLSIVSGAILVRYKQFYKSRWFKHVVIIGLVVGLAGAMKAGSRGPMISGIVALLFIALNASRKFKLTFIVAGMILLIGGGVTVGALKSFAPVLYERTLKTVEDGDTSGRDEIYRDAIEKLNDIFVYGGKAIIVNDVFFYGYHNVYLSIMMGLGVIVGGGYVLLIIYMLVYIFRKRERILKNPAHLFLAGMYVFFFVRGFTGINILMNCSYDLIILCSTVLVYNPLLIHYSESVKL